MANTDTTCTNGNGFWRGMKTLIPIIVLMFGAGSGWGLYAATASSTKIECATNKEDIKDVSLRLTEDEKIIIRVEERLISISEKLDEIKKQVDD